MGSCHGGWNFEPFSNSGTRSANVFHNTKNKCEACTFSKCGLHWKSWGPLPLTFGTKLLKQLKRTAGSQSCRSEAFPSIFRSHAFADDSNTSAHLSSSAHKRRLSLSFLMDASIIFHYQEQISIDAQELLPRVIAKSTQCAFAQAPEKYTPRPILHPSKDHGKAERSQTRVLTPSKQKNEKKKRKMTWRWPIHGFQMQTQAFAGVQPQVTWPPLQRGSGQAAITRAVIPVPATVPKLSFLAAALARFCGPSTQPLPIFQCDQKSEICTQANWCKYKVTH